MINEPGLVLKAQSGFYQVQVGGDVVTCQLRGKLKRGVRFCDLVAIGDRVTITRINSREGAIESIEPRRRVLSRLDPRPQGMYEQVLLANPDQLLAVFACAHPAPHRRMLDRFLVIAEKQRIPAIIIANKCDLIPRTEAEDIFKLYQPIGYRVIYTSAITGEGVAEVRDLLKNKLSALTGPSGVGKSSLASRIQTNLKLRSSEISEATGKGRHTTEVRELHTLEGGGFLADMPGLRALALWDIRPEELDGYFPEIRGLVKTCQFNNCTHHKEPGCAVREAARDGRVHPERYRSYLAMRFSDLDIQGLSLT
jgi:ribosome biogenesis GTPase